MGEAELFLEKLGQKSREDFKEGRHILSYREYLSQVLENPRIHLRDAATYLRDMFDFYGTREVEYPWGKRRRFKLFDQPFGSKSDSLSGQEEAQEAFYNILQSFVREGRPHRLIMLHGPNGSSKSTFVDCIARAMEHYSTTPEGALYRFNWIFPAERTLSSRLGFVRREGEEVGRTTELAHLDEEDIDAKLPCELRDHPLLLLPLPQREEFIQKCKERERSLDPIPELLAKGGVCPKCKQIFDALLAASRGDLTKVLAHVQVERYFVSRRYRQAFATIGPQIHVDAGERQITVDRSLGALPKALQNVSLFEPYGDLIDGSGGIIEFSDLLKRPLESFKYLLETIESSEVQAGQSIQRLNAVLIATSNEIHLSAFKQHPDSISFLSRIAAIRMPYILHEPTEREIYENRMGAGVGKHVAPHAIETASTWAVLSRLLRPDPDRFEPRLRPLLKDFLCTEKFDLYAEGRIPPRFSSEETKLFAGSIDKIYTETENQPIYEGLVGASPREIKFILYQAAQNPSYRCLVPIAVIEEIENLVKRTKDYPFLAIEKKEGHYHDFKYFIDILKLRLNQKVLLEAVESSALFNRKQFEELWDRYILHAGTWTKGERIFNPVTKKHESPDEALMERVESLLEVKDKKEFRQEILSRIAASVIERGRTKPDYTVIFSRHIETLKTKIIRENLPKLKVLVEKAIAVMGGVDDKCEREDTPRKSEEVPEEVNAFVTTFQNTFSYCPYCARTALGYLLRERLANV